MHSSPALWTSSTLRSIKCVKAGLLSVMIRVCIKGLTQRLLKWTERLLTYSGFLIVPHFLLSGAYAYVYRNVWPNHFLYLSKLELSVIQMNRLTFWMPCDKEVYLRFHWWSHLQSVLFIVVLTVFLGQHSYLPLT